MMLYVFIGGLVIGIILTVLYLLLISVWLKYRDSTTSIAPSVRVCSNCSVGVSSSGYTCPHIQSNVSAN